MTKRLQNKVAVITGGASGIGRGIARLFVEEGARVVIADIQEEKGMKLVEELGSSNATFVKTDVTKEQEIENCINAAVENFGGLHCMVNNAGAGGYPGPIEEMTEEAYHRDVNLLLYSVYMGMKHATPHLKKAGGGSIVNLTSIAGVRAEPAALVYSGAKAGVMGATRAAALQLAEFNIRVNAIAPGAIVSSLFKDFMSDFDEDDPATYEQAKQLFSQLQPLKRAGEPRDIAEAALYLASDGASFMTGQTLVVDGGATVGVGGQVSIETFKEAG